MWDFLENLKFVKGIAKPYFLLISVGIVILYFTNTKDENTDLANTIGYGFLILGFIVAIITTIINIKINLYEDIIEKHKDLLQSSSESLKSRENMIQNQQSLNTKEENNKKETTPVSQNTTEHQVTQI